MATPFSYEPAKAFLYDVSHAEDAASLIETTLQAFTDAMYAIDDETRTELIPETLCIQVWICGCLLDAIANDAVYEPEAAKYGLSDEFRLAEKATGEAFSRKKGLFFRKPLHDMRELASQADDCLLVLDHEDYTELGKRLMGTDTGSELTDELTALNIRLEDHFDPQD